MPHDKRRYCVFPQCIAYNGIFCTSGHVGQLIQKMQDRKDLWKIVKNMLVMLITPNTFLAILPISFETDTSKRGGSPAPTPQSNQNRYPSHTKPIQRAHPYQTTLAMLPRLQSVMYRPWIYDILGLRPILTFSIYTVLHITFCKIRWG